ncbi:MAG: serine/threonine-protein kinase PknK, partial [Acidobacteriota bacterium]
LAVVDTIRGADIQTRHLLLALRAGEPYRISRALALEAAYCSTSGGRSRRRTEKLIQASTRLAEQVKNPHATGLVTAVSGTAAYLGGRWRQARELLREAEEILLGSCTGVAWELSNVRFFSIASLFWLGELKELSRWLPDVLKNAGERGDLLLATQLRAWGAHLMYLAADQPDKAREEGRHAIERWSHQGFHIQHYEETWAQVNIALYSGDKRAAWDLVSERWPALKRSLLLRIQIIFIPALGMRAASALAAAASGIEPWKLLRVAERDARRIEGEKVAWADPLAQLIRAGVVAMRGEVAVAVVLLASAEEGFEAVDMTLYAAVARRRRGELIGGEQGRTLVNEADDWMTGQEIRNPGRMTAMLAPGRWTSPVWK